MTEATVLFDHRNGFAYYLAFDLLLARAPLREGRIETAESRAAEGDDPEAERAAREAAIKVALLRADFGDDEGWASTVEDAQRRAEELAAVAGLLAPPSLDSVEIRRTELG